MTFHEILSLKVIRTTVKGTDKLIYDVAPHGKIQCFRTVNGRELTGNEFLSPLKKKAMRNETTYQNR